MKLKVQFHFETKDGQWANLPQAYAVIEASEAHIVDQCLKAENLDELPPIIERVVVNEAKDVLHLLEKDDEYSGNFGFEVSELKWWEGVILEVKKFLN